MPPRPRPPRRGRFRFRVFPILEECLLAHGSVVITPRATALDLRWRFFSPAGTRGTEGPASPGHPFLEPRGPEAAAAPRGPPCSVSWGPTLWPQARPGCSSGLVVPLSKPSSAPCGSELPPLLPGRVTGTGVDDTGRTGRDPWGGAGFDQRSATGLGWPLCNFKQRVPVWEMGNVQAGETIPARPPLPSPVNPESKERRQGILILPSLSQIHRLIESLLRDSGSRGSPGLRSPGAASAPQAVYSGDIRSADSAAQATLTFAVMPLLSCHLPSPSPDPQPRRGPFSVSIQVLLFTHRTLTTRRELKPPGGQQEKISGGDKINEKIGASCLHSQRELRTGPRGSGRALTRLGKGRPCSGPRVRGTLQEADGVLCGQCRPLNWELALIIWPQLVNCTIVGRVNDSLVINSLTVP